MALDSTANPFWRAVSFVAPWSSDFGAQKERSESFFAPAVAASSLPFSAQLLHASKLDFVDCVYDESDIDWWSTGARTFKLSVGTLILITGLALTLIGHFVAITPMFYVGIGVLSGGGVWFLLLFARNNTTGRGLPWFIPFIGGFRLGTAMAVCVMCTGDRGQLDFVPGNDYVNSAEWSED